MGSHGAARGPLLRRDQPVDSRRLHHRLRAQSEARRAGDRAAHPQGLADGAAEYPPCLARRRYPAPQRPHGARDRRYRLRDARDGSDAVPHRPRMSELTPIEVGLTAAIVAVNEDRPLVLVAGEGAKDVAGLPFGPFDPLGHRTLEMGLRGWVSAQTALNIGYVEQLYTFGDRGRHARPGDSAPHVMSVGYLALTRVPENTQALRNAGAGFEPRSEERRVGKECRSRWSP